MRGERELRCLNIVKDAMFCKDGKHIQNPFTHKTYLDVSDAEFKKDRIWLVNSECHKSYFGLEENNREEFESVLRVAQANLDASRFPDFIFENGFIEHFQVTSSPTTRRGATHTRKESEFHRTVDIETKEIESEWNGTPSFDKVRSKSWAFSNPIHSYEFLSDSFRSNWQHHMESYKKYTGSKQIGIFMVEYPEIALTMRENVYHDWIDGMSQGDMREQEKFKEYRLSRDKKLLEYIYQFKNEIQYVIFLNQVRVEVIRTENILYLIKLLPWDYVIYPLQVTNVASVYNISVSVDQKQGDEIND
ncbi:MAG: hypothetical protein HFH61_04860 [Lachnospiraceae bacterium]|nr:hypothetical protein [Lachnospiraceae bacterium]MCI8814582.1 hypothetical protein [Lachnospiraceae bacterium]